MHTDEAGGIGAVSDTGTFLSPAHWSGADEDHQQAVTEVIGLRFQDWSLEDVAESLVSAARNGIRRQVYFVNAHCVNMAMGDAAYLSILRNAPCLYADGVGMALAARIWGARLEHNVNGTDLFPVLCRNAERAGVPIALLGASPGIAEACAEKVRKLYPGLNIVWTHHGYASAEEEACLLTEIEASGARILFVAKGVPMQELWIHENAPRLEVPVVMGVGALFDFYSGAVPRAPLFMRRMRMEWFFRFLVEPRRLFGRYFVGCPVFLRRVVALRYFGK